MDFRLKVFLKVAEKLSFTKAASSLYITQPAVTKHIRALENKYGTLLFHRKGNKIELTESGKILLNYARKICSLYDEIDFEINALKDKRAGFLRIGASTTITQYVLPGLMAKFKERFPEMKTIILNGNTEFIERLLNEKKIDLGIIEGFSKRPGFHYREFTEDRIELVRATKFPGPDSIDGMDELTRLPVVMREEGSGTREVIAHHLKEKGINLKQLNIVLQIGSTEGMKRYLQQTPAYAFLSLHSIRDELKNNTLRIIPVKDLQIKRSFRFFYPEGEPSPVTEWFIRYAMRYNF